MNPETAVTTLLGAVIAHLFSVIAHLFNQSEARTFQIRRITLSLLLLRVIRPSNNNLKMVTAIVWFLQRFCHPGTFTATATSNSCDNAPKYGIEAVTWCAGKVKSNSQCHSLCWA